MMKRPIFHHKTVETVVFVLILIFFFLIYSCPLISVFSLEESLWTLSLSCKAFWCGMMDRKPLNPNVPHAPKRPVVLSKEEFVKAVQNALRYFPEKYHAVLGPEFAEELKTYGHIYMYRYGVVFSP